MSDLLPTTLPEHILDFLSGIDAVRFAQMFVKTYGLSDAKVSEVMNLGEDIVYGVVPVEKLPDEIVSRFQFDPNKAKQAALELAEARLLPIEAFIGNVRGFIKTWGGDLTALPVSENVPMTSDVFVHTFVASLPGRMPAHAQQRLEHFLGLYATGHSNRAQIMEMFLRAEKVGGMEFEKEDAEQLLNFFDEEKKKKNIEGKKERRKEGKKMEGEKPEETNVIGGVPTPSKEQAIKKDVVIDDVQEIAKIAEEKKFVLEKPKTPLNVEEAVEQLCASGALKIDDPKLQDRCKQIVESCLREVRTLADTQKQLERPIESGGLGVTGLNLADMMQAIKQQIDVFQRPTSEKVAEEKAMYLEKRAEEQVIQQTLAEKEERVMTKRYVELTGKVPENHVTPAAPSLARVSAATNVAEAISAREQKVDTQKVRRAIEEAKRVSDPPLTPPLPAGRHGLSRGEESSLRRGEMRPQMQDVKFAKRLSGPIDQLHAMTLVDFRRLSKTSSASIQKIKDQVDLVEEEGFERKVEAIRAWQSSPLYQMYLSLVRQAMIEGKPLEEIRSSQEAKDGSGFTKEELSEILKLNTDLRF